MSTYIQHIIRSSGKKDGKKRSSSGRIRPPSLSVYAGGCVGLAFRVCPIDVNTIKTGKAACSSRCMYNKRRVRGALNRSKLNASVSCFRYDFDVEGNGTFRLFPSGTNSYPRRAEVLNSYGRRANDNLLLEYGFAMLDNEWDTAEVVCSLSPCDRPLERRRKEFLRSSGQNTVRWVLRGEEFDRLLGVRRVSL